MPPIIYMIFSNIIFPIKKNGKHLRETYTSIVKKKSHPQDKNLNKL